MEETPHNANRDKEATVWLVDDDPEIMVVLPAVIDETQRLKCTGVYENASDALRTLANGNPPDVLLLDVRLPGMLGVDAVRPIRNLSPLTLIIMLTGFEDDDFVFQALHDGAIGYILKPCNDEELIARIDEALAGGAPMSPKIARKVLSMLAKQDQPVAVQLSDRETDYGLES